jgi:hypothetical protein
VTLTPGQTFYEGPDDVHVVGRNASKTKPAKFVVFLVKNKGAPILVPANEANRGDNSYETDMARQQRMERLSYRQELDTGR